MNKIINIKDNGIWIYLSRAQFNISNRESFKDITGKYLFFSKDKKLLSTIAIDEILNNGFSVAKISSTSSLNGHVLCLYYKDDSRKHELKAKYGNNESGLQYRYWKSDQATDDGIYSEEYLRFKKTDQIIKIKNKKELIK